MSLIQVLLSSYFAFIGAYLSVVLTRTLIQNGRAIRELSENIRELGEKMAQQHQDMVELMKQQHQDVVDLIKQQHQDVVDLIKQQHQDAVELLKKGFGDLSRDIREIKEK